MAYTDPELAKQLASAQPSVSTQPEASGVMDELFTDQTPPTAASAEELGRQLDDIQVRLAQQSDNLKLLDAALTQRSADQARMPTAMPITDYPYLSSSYGWRRNPVTGRSALHEGWTSPRRRARPFLPRRVAWCWSPSSIRATATWSRSTMATA